MRYVADRERVLALYRTLPQWVEIVQAASRCAVDDAKHQILGGLKDNKFAIRWKETDTERETAGDHRPWREATITSEWINWDDGTILCDQSLTDEGRAAGSDPWLTLLLAPKGATIFVKMQTALGRSDNVVEPPAGGSDANVVPLGRYGSDALRASVRACAPKNNDTWKEFAQRVAKHGGRTWDWKHVERCYRDLFPNDE